MLHGNSAQSHFESKKRNCQWAWASPFTILTKRNKAITCSTGFTERAYKCCQCIVSLLCPFIGLTVYIFTMLVKPINVFNHTLANNGPSQKSIKADSRSLNNLSGYLATSKQCTDRLPQSDLESDFGIGLFYAAFWMKCDIWPVDGIDQFQSLIPDQIEATCQCIVYW